jgi:hypothetical protein
MNHQSQQAECVSNFLTKHSQFAMGVASYFTPSNDNMDNALQKLHQALLRMDWTGRVE